VKRGRSFLILLAVAAALGGYIWFVEMKRDLTASDTPAEKLFALDASQIQEVRVRNAAGDESTIRRAGDRWTFADAGDVEVDATEAGNITTSLASLESQRAVDDQPASLDEFGLASPRFSVAFKDTAGAERTLLVGNRTPTGGDLYAKLADAPRVFLIGSWLEETFNRSRFDLRDKAALKFPRDAVTGVTIVSAAGTVSLAQSGGEWKLTAPEDAPADNGAADALVNALSSARMTSVVEAPDMRATGLARPALTASVTAGPTRAVLEIGSAAESGDLYARDAVRNLVFTVDASLLDQLAKTPADLKRKDQ
jgi:hypothetical protein